MNNKIEEKKLKKSFFARWLEKLDKKMEEKGSNNGADIEDWIAAETYLEKNVML